MEISTTSLAGLIIIQPKVRVDHRGYFYESHHHEHYRELGIPTFKQDNISHSKRHVLRGLHFQNPYAQGKLVGVTHGKVWDVAVDIRVSSPTFGQWFGITLSDTNHTQMYIPPGFAHGFCVLSDTADFYYKCTDIFAPEYGLGIAWNDPALNIAWPVTNPILSPKDEILPALSQVPHEQLFA